MNIIHMDLREIGRRTGGRALRKLSKSRFPTTIPVKKRPQMGAALAWMVGSKWVRILWRIESGAKVARHVNG
jgi:hypothetical protein